MFTKHELVVIYEALDELHPSSHAQFKDGVKLKVADLSDKVLRLINESESTISEEQAEEILALDPVNLPPSQYEIAELDKARKILESRQSIIEKEPDKHDD
ncbi:hypothetical protein CSE15_16540 [Bacillus altitudinis]|uniref:hypothetical protein n=1 Tax=Bacillus altitudinis TaxID=293387 RepID=UPI000C1600E0|nr:hypothetical protein [Bacillus altitudinis]ATP95454.1 hypothetical protein CSE15_16540 [Bacillus altitudinis]